MPWYWDEEVGCDSHIPPQRCDYSEYRETQTTKEWWSCVQTGNHSGHKLERKHVQEKPCGSHGAVRRQTYECFLERGHDGPHQGRKCGSKNRRVETWPNYRTQSAPVSELPRLPIGGIDFAALGRRQC